MSSRYSLSLCRSHLSRPERNYALERVFSFILVFSLIFTSFSPGQSVQAQSSDPQKKAEALLAKLSTEEKVGQLFLVTFDGMDVSENTKIYDLIVNRHVGGVILSADKNNFSGPNDTVSSAQELIGNLQTTDWNGRQQSTDGGGNYIPLWVGLAQEGDGAPNDQIFQGLTPLPSEMMLGATWDTSLAEQAGVALGSDLNALGVNLLLGPSLDVLANPGKEGSDDLGVRAFGGDPFWVGELGKAYITGLHTGSNHQMVVISKHFPGRGSADRPLDTEVATVRKSLEQLKQIELAPFFAVTSSTEPDGNTDGLMVSHLRYQGFQGNIRATTKPISLDSSALSEILALSEFSSWRESGGLMMSDNLGGQAIRRFMDSTLQTFDQRQVARSAFLAGNDLLYVDNFGGTGGEDSYTGIAETLDFFVQRYNQDSAFAEKVDQSVLRVLAAKYKIYPQFTINAVKPDPNKLSNVGKQNGLEYTAAQEAATLIDPSASELSSVLPDPPSRADRIVFLTDTIKTRQCSSCDTVTLPAVDGLQKAVISAYGPLAGNQVTTNRLSSYSFQNVMDWLNNADPPETIGTDLSTANWIVFAIQNLDSNRPASYALKRLLSDKPDLFRGKNVVVFSLAAPYYLDSTDLSKITAYYGLYGKSQANLNVAALLLFQELMPHGSSPVSISGVGYDLITATSPDPNQVISLMLDVDETPLPTPATVELTLTPESIPLYKIGDTLPIRTGQILDQNGHVVPDGTVVRFILSTGADANTPQQVDAVTVAGVARSSFKIATPGLLQIRATADPAQKSDIIQIDVPMDSGAIVVAVTPTPEATDTLSVTPTEALTPSPTAVPVENESQPHIHFWEWFLSILVVMISSVLTYYLGANMHNDRWGIRWALCTAIGGLSSYIYLALGLPGAASWLALTSTTGLIGVVFLFSGLGWVMGILWHSLPEKGQKKHGNGRKQS